MKIETACLGCIVVCFVIIASVSITFPAVEAQESDTHSWSNVKVQSSDGFSISTSTLKISNNYTSIGQGHFVVAGNNIYLTGIGFFPKVEGALMMSQDGGNTFSVNNDSNTFNVNNDSNSFQPVNILTDGSNIFVVGRNITQDKNNAPTLQNSTILKSVDGGNTFNFLPLKDCTRMLYNTIKIDGNNLYAICTKSQDLNSQLFLFRSTDGGLTFSSSELNPSLNEPNIGVPIATNDKFYLVSESHNQNNSTLFIYSYTLDGNIVSNKTITIPGNIDNINMAINNNNLFIIGDQTPNKTDKNGFSINASPQIILIKYSINENTYIIQNINKDGFYSHLPVPSIPMISASGNNIYLAWTGKNGNSETNQVIQQSDIFIKISTDGGNTFSPLFNISENGYADMPTITTTDQNMYVAWTGLNTEIESSPVNPPVPLTLFVTKISIMPSTVPEFPFAIPILLVSFVSVIAFYRMRKPATL